MGKNILMILTDQMHKYAMGTVREHVISPNLDRLAGEGSLFTNAYSNNPVCGPYRGNLFSGMHTCGNGVEINGAPLPDIENMADTFNANGYETSFVGKWHLGDEGNKPIPRPLRGGFRHFIGYQCYNGFHDNVCFYDENDEEHFYHTHRTDVTTDLGIDRLKKVAKTGNPFLHVVFYQAPHYPEQPSDAFYEMYRGNEMPCPPNYVDIDPYTPTFSPPSPKPVENCPDYRRYGGNMQEYMRMYNAMVTQIDQGVGRILQTLETLGLEEDTMVLFSSDHGDMQGSHGMKNKCLPYEESCGVPLIIKAPGYQPGRKVNTPVSCIDFYPTFVEFAEVSTERGFEGRSLLPYLAEGDSSQKADRRPVFAENYLGEQHWTLIRDGKYKLVVDKATLEPYLLFDMERDPFEMDNLVGKEEHGHIVEQLNQKIRWFLDTCKAIR